MADYEYGDRNGSDVVVVLVPSPFALDQTEWSETERPDSLTRKRKRRNPEDEEELRILEDEEELRILEDEEEPRILEDEEELRISEDLHLHSDRLRACSKYFDVYLSERWGQSETRQLTLDVYTDVKYYKDCFSRMYSPWQKIPSVSHCLKLLQVASQICYDELEDTCVRYLAAVPWSHGDEQEIRAFADSPYYPSGRAAELSERLGIPLSSTERYQKVLGLTHAALQECFDLAVKTSMDDPDRSRCLFASMFRKLTGPEQDCRSDLLQGFLEYVRHDVERRITSARIDLMVGNSTNFVNEELDSVHWIFNILLETGFASELVEFMVEKTKVNLVLRKIESIEPTIWVKWLRAIVRTIEEVMAGRLLLKASTRTRLFQQWSYSLRLGCRRELCGDKVLRRAIPGIVSTFIMTFPFDSQHQLMKGWIRNPVHGKWVVNLQKSLISLDSDIAGENEDP